MYRMYVEQMLGASSAADRKAVVAAMCHRFAFSTAKAYKVLKENGWESGRAKRKDAGTTSMDETLLLAVAQMTTPGIRKNGKTTLPVNIARSILQARGLAIAVGDSRLRELLRVRHLSLEDSRMPTPHQPMRSEYPNQVHCVDPSVALLYYAPGGKQKIIGDDEEYKNKHFLKDKPKCYRYVLTDHYSDSVCVRYYAERGETAATRYDFLLYAWGQKPLNTYVFHGVPELLIWDCGSGNIAKATTNALTAFGVKTVPHLPGNPRGKGQLVGMEVRVQPIPVSAQPVCMVSYEHEGETVSFEVEPIQYDEAGFHLDAPVFGKQYQRPKDTVREQHAKGFEQAGVEAVMGPAHSFIQPENPFMRPMRGTPIAGAERVHTQEILIGAVEMAKRVNGILGYVPEGLVKGLRQAYPVGVPAQIGDELVQAVRQRGEAACKFA